MYSIMYPLKQIHYSTSRLLSSSSSSWGFQQIKPWQNATCLPFKTLLSPSKRGTIILLSLSSSLSNHNSPITTLNLQPTSSCPLTPIDFLERAALVYGDCPSIIYNDTTHTWSQTHIRCLKLASSIVSLGITKGDVVSVLAPNIPAMCELHFGVPMAGAILNTLNLRLDANAISNLLQHSQSKLVFVDYEYALLVEEALSLFPSSLRRPVVILIEDKEYNSSAQTMVDENGYDYINYEQIVANGDPEFKWIRPASEWDPLTLNYTSGTTSSPKGVVHSHRGSFLISLNSLLDWSVPKQPVYLWTLPMFHVNGWSYAWGMAAVGGTNICLRRIDAASIYENIRRYKVTHMCGAPVVLTMLTNHQPNIPLENPVHVMTSGAPPPPVVIGRAESLGFVVSHGYGLTEVGGPVVTCAWKEEWDRLPCAERAKLKARQGVGTVGFVGVDVVEVGSGESVPRDGVTMGEIVLRGGSLMVGYFRDPDGTSKCFRGNGWFYTGDVGVVHPDGYLEVKDRLKDVIICGGENLSSVEVEAVLYSHPMVTEAAVVARSDGFWGETPCAFVSLKEDVAEKPSEKEIREFCKVRLPLYMVPRRVVFKDQLPRTSTGKVQKFLLREMTKHLGSF